MAKGPKRSNREPRKPKAAKKPVTFGAATQYQLPVKLVTYKGLGK